MCIEHLHLKVETGAISPCWCATLRLHNPERTAEIWFIKVALTSLGGLVSELQGYELNACQNCE